MKRWPAFLGILVFSGGRGFTAGQSTATLPEGVHANALQILAQSSGLQAVDGSPVKCGFPLISYGTRHRSGEDQRVRGAMQVLDVRPTLQTSSVTGRFRIHFDTTGPNTPAMLDPSHTSRISNTAQEFVDSVAVAASFVYHFEVDSLGYQAPPSDGANGGGPEYDIYIVDLGRQYGYTAPDSNALPEGGRTSGFVVIDNDFIFVSDTLNRGIPGMCVTIAHEFHHMIQIGSYGYWTTELYFHEITSTWLEDVVYPSVKDYLQYVWSSNGHFANPGVPFNASDIVWYSRAIWAHFIAKRFGADIIRHSWEMARTVRPLQAIDNTLRAYSGSSFTAAFAEWTLWNYFTGTRADSAQYYPEGALYRLITQIPCSYAGAPRVVPDSVAPLASSYHQVTGASKPLTLITANIDFQSALSWSAAREGYSYALSPSKSDDGFRATAAGVYVKLDAVNRSHWWDWDVVNGIVGVPQFDEATPFPNPFIADGSSRIFIPSTLLSGTLSIYSSSMALVYQSDLKSILHLGKRVFSWDGRTNDNEAAQTGVYVYVLSLDDRLVAGKIALVRRR